MTHKDIAERIDRALKAYPEPGLREEMEKLRDTLNLSQFKPGALVWWRDAEGLTPWELGKITSDGRAVCTFHSIINALASVEYKPAYVAPPDTDPGTEALIDELRDRIAELEDALFYVMDDFQKWPGDISKAAWDKAEDVMREVQAREAGR